MNSFRGLKSFAYSLQATTKYSGTANREVLQTKIKSRFATLSPFFIARITAKRSLFHAAVTSKKTGYIFVIGNSCGTSITPPTGSAVYSPQSKFNTGYRHLLRPNSDSKPALERMALLEVIS